MNKNELALIICDTLEEMYPDAVCSLTYEKPYELMIAVRLSAQCKDERVNMITPLLFEKYPTLESFANADKNDIEKIIRPCGLSVTKSESIVLMCQRLLYVYNGILPDNMEDLLTFPGIGRKTANLLLGDVYKKEGVVVTDTHCIRISGRLTLTDNKDPKKVEDDLRKILPPDRSSDLCHRLVLFGREYCKARSPLCDSCPLRKKLCEKVDGFECKR